MTMMSSCGSTGWWEKHEAWRQETWVQVPVLPLAGANADSELQDVSVFIAVKLGRNSISLWGGCGSPGK